MSGHGNASTSVTIGDVNVAAGATAILGTNHIGPGVGHASKLRDCTNALFITDPKVDRSELLIFKGERVKGTGEWIRQDETYKAWLNSGDSRLLRISGGPGRGKTMLSIFLTVELQILSRHSPTEVLFYFCRHGSEKHSTAATILRTLLHQIFEKQPELARHAVRRMETEYRKRETLGSPGALWQIFLEVLADPNLGPLTILLDGLDECKDDSTKWLVRSLQTIFDPSGRALLRTPNAVKILILSREIVGLLGFPRLDLESKIHAIASDVHHVIETKLREHPAYRRLDPDFWNEVVSVIQQRCYGTFLWAGLVVNEILDKATKSEIEQVLVDVPEGLDAIYARILSQIPSNWRKQVARVLHWIAAATMPLSISQLEEAWNIDRNDAEHHRLHDLVAMSGSLLNISKVRKAETLALIHSSVGDCLLRPTFEGDPMPTEFRFEKEKVHFDIAETCLGSINKIDLTREKADLRREIWKFGGLETAFIGTNLGETQCHNNHENWISYAVYTWAEHAQSCGEAATKLLDCTAPFFRDQSALRDLWWYLVTHPCGCNKPYYGDINNDVDKGMGLLHVLSGLGLTFMVSILLQRTSCLDEDYVNRSGVYGCTALSCASFFGHESTVILLLLYGARVTEGYQIRLSALQAAFEKQHYEVAKRLLAHYAFHKRLRAPEQITSLLQTDLLFHAFGAEDVRLVKLLYDNGLGTTSPAPNVVMNAIRHASLPVLEFLLKQDFDINLKDEDTGWSCLAVAAARSDSNAVSVVEALLKHGAKVNKSSEEGITPLHLVAAMGNGAAIPVLLSYGADVDAVFLEVVRPVDLAVMHAKFKVAEMLLGMTKNPREAWPPLVTFDMLCRIMASDDNDLRECGMEDVSRDDRSNDGETSKRLCEELLRRGVNINHEFPGGSTFLDLFRKPLLAYQLDFVQLLMQHSARCKLDEDTEKLQKLLERRFRDGVSVGDWDAAVVSSISERVRVGHECQFPVRSVAWYQPSRQQSGRAVV